MRFILLICSMLMLNLSCFAESLKFSEQTFDFGTIAEDGGDVTHTFEFRNDGSTPVVIRNVVTSCGCTTPSYTRKPIKSGEVAELKIDFDPRFRPGSFSKSISVYTTDSSEAIELRIMGRVTPRVQPLEERYPYKIGDEMRISALFVSFRAVPQGRLVQQVVELRNMADRERSVEFRSRAVGTPLQIYSTERIAASGEGSLEVAYYVESGRGQLADTLDIYIDGRKIDKYISIKGLIVE